MKRASALVCALLATCTLFAAKPGALPLDLAFSSRDVRRDQRPVLAHDGRYVAFEIRTPPVKTPDVEGKIEPRALPNGLPADFVGMHLWVSETQSGESHAVCDGAWTCWRGAWSPNGRLLAYYATDGGPIHVRIYDAVERRSRKVSDALIKPKLWHGDQAAWSPDGSTLYVPLRPPDAPKETAPAPSESHDAQPTVTVHRTRTASESAGVASQTPTAALNAFLMQENNATLAAIDVKSGATRIVVPFDAELRPNNLRLSPDGKWISYLSVYQLVDATSTDVFEHLVIVPAAGGTPLVVFRDIKLPDVDYFGGTYRWTPDSKRIVFLKNDDLWIADIAPDAKPRRLGASLGKIAESPLLLTADGKSIVVGIEPEGEKSYYVVPPRALAIVPLDGKEPHVLEMSGVPVNADDSTLYQPSADAFLLIRDVPSSAQREIVEVDKATGRTKRVWSGQGRFDVVGAKGDRIVARFEGLATPPDYYLFNRSFERVRRLSHAEPRLDAVTIGPMESFDTVLPKHDGTLQTVRTYIYLPAGAKRGDRVPTVIYFYSGLPFSRYAHDYGGGAPNSIPVQVFASRGYGVLFCDVPLGPEGKGGNPVQEMTNSVLAQVYRAAELGYSDILRLAIMGQSYGGYSTAAILTQTSLFRAGLALDGMYDLGHMYARMDRSGGSFGFIWSESGQGRMGTHPWADLHRYIANSPYYQAHKIVTPLLLIHGEKDGACPVEEAQKMFNALKRLDREAELAVYAGEGHVPGEWGLVNAIDATQRMLDFLARHLGTE